MNNDSPGAPSIPLDQRVVVDDLDLLLLLEERLVDP
jgi:hypothetical protein